MPFWRSPSPVSSLPIWAGVGRIVVYSVAALNAVARIYLGAHNPLDVVGGAGLGIAIAGALNFAFGVPDQPNTGHAAEGVAD
jgi:membrane-associated phospholipid phosphatase